MSERGVAFIERWIAENVSSETSIEGGAQAGFEQLAKDALRAARSSGVPEMEILEEFPDRGPSGFSRQ